ncbi:hypothetical protein M0805_003102 [Coniferiporia weirii]|nr:hypothetical protein M0805_003102 [Coniferiporia weirii]
MPPATIPPVCAPVPRRPHASSRRVPHGTQPSSLPPPPALGFERSIPRCSTPRDAPTRLLSPARIPERRSRPPCSGSPSPACSTTKRRRASHLSRSTARVRHCKLVDCSIIRGGSAIFDQLPWISSLEDPPAIDLLNPWDLADLSLLPRDGDGSTASEVGPIRSRKSSLRSAPFPTDLAEITPELSPSRSTDSLLLELPFSHGRRLSVDDDVLKTPPPRASMLPVDAGFHNLMPIAFADDTEESWWQRESLSP